MRKVLSTIFILIGVIFISLPYLNQRIIKYNMNKTEELVKESTKEELKANQNLQAEFDYESIRDIDITSTIKDTPKFEHKALIGEIFIPNIGMHLPILKGVNNPNLLLGAATMKDGITMGQGNYSLAGHYVNKKGVLFGGLIDIEIGSQVKTTDKEYIYEYIIYDTKIVSETDLYMLEDIRAEERGNPIISLMSCYYTSKNGKRFFALGELVDKYPYDEEIFQ